MRSWQGRSCRKMVQQLEDERSMAVGGRAMDQDGRLAPSGVLPRSIVEIDVDIVLWKSRLAGPDPTPPPAVESPACFQCGKRLQATFEHVSVRVETSEGFHTIEEPGKLLGFGYAARGHFCSLRCGWQFAVVSIESRQK